MGLILAVVAPVDHKCVVPALEVSVVHLRPHRKVVEAACRYCWGSGKAFTVTTLAADAALWQPAAFATCTV